MNKLLKLSAYGLCISLWFCTGCSSGDEPEPFDCNASDLAIDVVEVDPVDCLSTGSVTISGIGGTETYMYALDNGTFQESGSFANIVQGTHVAKVKDGKGCIVQEDVDLTSISSTAEIISVMLEISGCKTSNGSITITATGSGALSYSLDNINFTNATGVFTDLAAGTYSVYVKDEGQCLDSQGSVKVTTGVSLTVDIEPIIDVNCATNNCHVSGGIAPFSLETKAQIREKATLIKSAAVTNGTMPKNNPGGLSTNNKNLIACWVDDGALNN